MLILAAGESKRMGKIKQLLPWKKTTLLGHTIEQGLACNIDSLFVVLGANAEIIETEVKKYDTTILKNPDWKKGMGSSLSYGIKQLLKGKQAYDGVIVALTDQPLLERAHYQKLIDVFNKSKKGIIATRKGKTDGAPALLSSNYFKQLADLTGDIGARKIIKANSEVVACVEVKDEGADLDVWEEYLRVVSNFK